MYDCDAMVVREVHEDDVQPVRPASRVDFMARPEICRYRLFPIFQFVDELADGCDQLLL
jgi:hypothetical protein